MQISNKDFNKQVFYYILLKKQKFYLFKVFLIGK